MKPDPPALRAGPSVMASGSVLFGDEEVEFSREASEMTASI